MTQSANEERNRRRRNVAIVLGILLIIVLILLALMRGCAVVPDGFNYLRAKAGELGDDPARIVAFVRDEVGTLEVRGDVKGALGTLWNGAGSPEEKKALAEALLAAARKPARVTLDDVAPTRAKDQDATAPAAPLQLALTHRALLGDAAPRETLVWKGPAGDLVGDVHSIETPEVGVTRIAVRAGADVQKDVDTKGATGEELVFSIERAGGEPFVVVRELWRAGDRVGPDRPQAGDRHDLAVLPCRVTKFVREKEEVLLGQRGRKEAPEARPYLHLLEWALDSDRELAKLERTYGVTAQLDLPRLLVLSRWPAPSLPGGFAHAFDLRLDRAGFRGPSLARAFQAAQVRAFVEAGLEQQFLTRVAALPTTSTVDVFSRLTDDVANTPTRRLSTILRALEDLERAGLDGRATFAARDPRGAKRERPVEVTVSRAPGGLRVQGGPVDEAFAKALAATPDAPRLPYSAEGTLDATFATAEEAAVAVESTLLAAKAAPPVGPSYVLVTALSRGTEPLVQPGATFDFAWGEGEGRTEQRVRVLTTEPDLTLRFRVQAEGPPVAGTRTVEGAALEGALVHNPWYRAGPSRQAEATSFCVSRRVHAALKQGAPLDLGLSAAFGPDDDDKAPRRVERQAKLAAQGAGAVEVLVNGRKERLPVLKARLDEDEVAVLDDPVFAVGLADRLRSVTTSARGRLVDEQRLPIVDATVALPGGPAATTAVDGTFRLPPPARARWGKVALTVTQQGASPGQVEVDLTAAGLGEVEVVVPRLRPELAWITQRNAADLDGLAVSEQVKRHARRDLAAGRLVVIPTRMVDDGLGGELIAYFSCDGATGDLVGVIEEGLHGASAWSRAVESAAQDVQAAVKGGLNEQDGASAPFHMLRGAIVAFWVYSAARVGGLGHKEAIISTLEQLDGWAENLQLAHFANQEVEKLLGGNPVGDKTAEQLTSRLSTLVGSGTTTSDNDAAKAAFKLGYLGATLFLASRLEDSD